MTNYQETAPAVKYESEPTELAKPLSYSQGYVYRGLYYSRFGKGRFPNATTFNAGRLLMVVNGYRDADGRTPIGERQLRRTLTALRKKGHIAFRSNRRRRKPTAKSFRRATYIEVVGGRPETLIYLERGRHRGQTHRLPRIQKSPLTATLREMSVDGHEVTIPPSSNEKVSVGGASSSADADNGSQKAKRTTPKTTKPTFSPNVVAAETELTSLAVTVSDALGTPWEPLAEKRPWRLRRLYLVLGQSPLTNYPEINAMVAGMAYQRSRDIERAEKHGRFHKFWELDAGDIVARVLAYDAEFSRLDHADRLERVGERVLWNLQREDECRLEAAVGAR